MTWTADDWSALASGGVAVGTLVLAKVTSRLAKKTSTSVDLSARELRSELTPSLVPIIAGKTEVFEFGALDGALCKRRMRFVPITWEEETDDGPKVWAIVPFRNIGKGPAFILNEPNAVMIHSTVDGGMTTIGRGSSTVLAPGDGAHLVFRAAAGQKDEVPLEIPISDKDAPMTVVVRYADIDRRQRTTSRFVYKSVKPTDVEDESYEELFDWEVSIDREDEVPG